MNEVIFLCHRIPFPPNKGDKVRSFHLLEALRSRYNVAVGSFIDDPLDRQYLDEIRKRSDDCFVREISPRWRKAAAARALFGSAPLTDAFYAHEGMRRWVRARVATRRVGAVVAFSSAMAQFVPLSAPVPLRRVMDFCDLDSDKWRQYAAGQRGPLALLYAREARAMRRREAAIAREFDACSFVSERESAEFCALEPQTAHKVFTVRNGVDAEYFDRSAVVPHADPTGGPIVAFTGAMDYWANIEGIAWFADRVWPLVRQGHPTAQLYIVGSRPSESVRALAARPGVKVTGSVPDVRPFLAGARVAVAPLRIARGVQNKVLEAMAMECVVVASEAAVRGLDIAPPADVRRAGDEAAFASAVADTLSAPPARSAVNREYVRRHYSWSANLERLVTLAGPAVVA